VTDDALAAAGSGNTDSRRGLVIVGPCAAGKTTLATGLRAAGYRAQAVAQEHSYVPKLWRRSGPPDLLIYLDVSLKALLARRPDSGFGDAELAEERRRLMDARGRCDLYLDTSDLTPAQVQAAVLAFLSEAAERG
jgi:hypothetical protein